MRTSLLLAITLIGFGVGCGDDSSDKPADAAIDSAPAVDAAPTVALDCPTYCTEIMTNCTGANAQYTSMNHCLGSCAAFPVGTSKVTDTTGDTLGCRIYHAGMPAKTDAALHCPHAGPAGEKLTNATPAACSGGNVCEDFCNIEVKTCGTTAAPITGITPTYADNADCLAKCGNFMNKDQNYSITAKGDSLACRLYHVTNAASFTVAGNINAAMQQTHCNHSAPTATAPCAGAP